MTEQFKPVAKSVVKKVEVEAKTIAEPTPDQIRAHKELVDKAIIEKAAFEK